MVADDAEPSDLGVYRGGPWAFTPNLDGIARKGAMFLKAHSAAPLCSPSRFTMLTGLHASCANARVPTAATVAAEGAAAMAPRSVDSEMSHLLPPADPKKKGWQRLAHRTLAHRLGAAGYVTGAFGLWHLGIPEPDASKKELKRVKETPPEKWVVAGGGKVKKTVLGEYEALQAHVKAVGGFSIAERLYAAPLDTDSVVLPSAMKVHNVEWVADGAAQFIQRHGDEKSPPFFLYVGWTLPHGPDAGNAFREAAATYTPNGMWKRGEGMVTATNEQRKELRQRTGVGEFGKAAAGAASVSPFEPGYQGHKQYALALAWMDRGVGTVLWALQRKGVAHATLIVFASDHAATDKGHCYTRGTAVPLIMQWPDALPQKARVGALVSLVDIVPTLLHAANLTATGEPRATPPEGGSADLHGRSLLPLLRGGPGGGAAAKSVHSELFCEIGKSRALLTPTHHYLLAPQPEGKKGPAGGGGSTYGASERHPAYYSEEQLYDLKADPEEKSDLVAKLNAAAAGGAAPTDPAWVVLGNLRSRLRGLLSNASARCFADGPW